MHFFGDFMARPLIFFFLDGECILCQIVNDNPMKLAPSKEQLDQLLLHHILVKVQQLEDTQKELKEKNQILDKMSNLVQVIIKSTSQFDQLNTRLKAVESIMQSTQNRADEVIGLKGELENLRAVLHFMLPSNWSKVGARTNLKTTKGT